ncbi:uncharacterized protein LOC106670797 [Cimex lectularius]|uniref:N-acetyltransferase domain-containing protein n=1 Tax=Cimex lectularius TaxID=79782 RepID=A0A8I6S4Y6_CIMLE|nr:uncharacterized protein LOC106670797 [Cimex lectularius]XP_014256879.1 uncharacterized protein LOC106670797 [Cimex lectularius]
MDEQDEGLEKAIMDTETVAFMARMKKPVVWCRLPFGVRIEELETSYYEEVVDLVKRHYIPDEPTFRSVKMSQDQASMDEFLSLCNVWIRDTCSLVAVEEGEKKAVGALIGRVCVLKDMNFEYSLIEEELVYAPPTETYHVSSIVLKKGRMSKSPVHKKRSSSKKTKRRQTSGVNGPRVKTGGKKKKGSNSRDNSMPFDPPVRRVNRFERPHDMIPMPKKKWAPVTVFYDEDMMYKTEPLRTVQTTKHFISKKFDIFKSLSKNKYYKIYMVVVHRDYRRKGIGKALLKCLFCMCRGYRIEVAAGIYPSFISQNMSFKLGGRIGYEMAYEDYAPFAGVPEPDSSLALMYHLIPAYENGKYVEKARERQPVLRRKHPQ